MIKLNNEYLFLKNYKPDKPLIIFTGHPRNWKVIAEYNKKFIKKLNANVIISAWTDTQFKKKKDSGFKEKKDFLDLIDFFKPIYLDIQKFNVKLTYKLFGKTNAYDKILFYAALSTRGQVYKIYRSLLIVKIIEKILKKKFKIIIKSRLDFIILNFNLEKKLKKNCIYFEHSQSGIHQLSDRFFYGSRNALLNFSKYLLNFSRTVHKIKIYNIHNIPVNESFFKICFDKYKIPYKLFFPISSLWKHQFKPSKLTIFFIILRTLYKYIRHRLIFIRKFLH